MTCRRDVLKGGLILSLSGLVTAPVMGFAADAQPQFLIDARLPEAAQLRRQAVAGGHRHADPNGEIIAQLMGEPHWLSPGTMLVGLTGYVDYRLAQDALRGAGRRILQVWQLGPTASEHNHQVARPGPVGALIGQRTAVQRSGATSFLWIA